MMDNTVAKGMDIDNSEGNISISSPSSFLETYHQLLNTNKTKRKAFVSAALLAFVATRPDGGHHGHHTVHAPVVVAPVHYAVHAALVVAQAVHAAQITLPRPHLARAWLRIKGGEKTNVKLTKTKLH